MSRRWVSTASCLVVTALTAGCTGSSGPGEPGNELASPSYLELREPAATRCAGDVGAVEIKGDLVVPRGKTCRLAGTAVGGRVNVTSGASLEALDARFGEGISAHGFRRVALLAGHAPGRPRAWSFLPPLATDAEVDFVFDGGGNVTVEDGPGDGHYYLIGNSGRVTIERLALDTGEIFCARNERRPHVRHVSAETPGKLQGQCAGTRNFDRGSDF